MTSIELFNYRRKNIDDSNNLQQAPSGTYHTTYLNERDSARLKEHKDAGKSCGDCKYLCSTSTSIIHQQYICKLKKGKQVKTYNICQYHLASSTESS